MKTEIKKKMTWRNTERKEKGLQLERALKLIKNRELRKREREPKY